MSRLTRALDLLGQSPAAVLWFLLAGAALALMTLFPCDPGQVVSCIAHRTA